MDAGPLYLSESARVTFSEQPPESTPADRESLVSQFVTAAGHFHAPARVIPAAPPPLFEAISDLTKDHRPVVLAEPVDLPRILFEPLLAAGSVITAPTEDQLDAAQVGITEGFAGLARTGSICVANNRQLAGAISLFAREHIAVIQAASIVSRPRDLFTVPQVREKVLSRDFVIVTGPSATADMGELVYGVHGPGKLHIIILE